MFDKFRDDLKEKYDFWEQDILDEDVMDFPEHTLIPAVVECDAFTLYRYMPANYFNIRNIETQTLHLSTNGVMNDVYEGVPDTDEVISSGSLQKLGDLAVMTCFSETNDNTLMWSHYAQNHEGFCVAYDVKKLKKDPYGLVKHLFPVIYDGKRPVHRNLDSLVRSHAELKEAIKGNICYEGEEPLDDVLPLFLVKGLDWKYEKEWRIIYTQKQLYDIDEDILYGGNVSFECISAVYLGYRINPVIKQNIIEIIERLNKAGFSVDLYQAKLAKEGYGIEFNKV